MSDDLESARRARLAAALASAPFDAFLSCGAANITYASGYRGMPAAIYARYQIAAFSTPERSVLVAPCGDAPAALAAGVLPDDFVAFGRAYYESPDGQAPETRMAENNLSFLEALAEGARRIGLGRITLGVDESSLDPIGRAALAAALPDARLVDASAWMRSVRSIKLPQEVARLCRAAELAEAGIQRALGCARQGWTERRIAAVIGQTMLEGGGQPRFLSVQVGSRAALGDAYPSDKQWQPGELLRMDVGCDVDGYWSDMARTAVLGEPTPDQRVRFEALLAGQQAEVAALRPGRRAGDLFDLAVGTTRRSGMPAYRRHHTGHGIGLEIYEPPAVAPGGSDVICEGMVLCLETPFYEMGWGGILTEDTLVVTTDGYRCFTNSSRELRVVAD